jgi:TPP-dependent pyruvate/acetoin dehydrogenase alpha subunit
VLIDLGLLTEEQADEMVVTAKRQGEEAIAYALASPHVQAEDGLRQVFADYAAKPTQFISHEAWS